jgi:hypothetical protein
MRRLRRPANRKDKPPFWEELVTLDDMPRYSARCTLRSPDGQWTLRAAPITPAGTAETARVPAGHGGARAAPCHRGDARQARQHARV